MSARTDDVCRGTQCGRTGTMKEIVREAINDFWLPPRDSNPDMLIQSQLSYH